jgi:hypothetical protein
VAYSEVKLESSGDKACLVSVSRKSIRQVFTVRVVNTLVYVSLY